MNELDINEDSYKFFHYERIYTPKPYEDLILGKFVKRFTTVEVKHGKFSLDPDYYIEDLLEKNPSLEYIPYYPYIRRTIEDFLQKCLMCGYCSYIFDKYNINSFYIECDARICAKPKDEPFFIIEMTIDYDTKIKSFARYIDQEICKNSSSNLEIHTQYFLPPEIESMCNIKIIPCIKCKKHYATSCFVYCPIRNVFTPPPYNDLPLFINVPFVSEYARDMLERGPIELPYFNRSNFKGFII